MKQTRKQQDTKTSMTMSKLLQSLYSQQQQQQSVSPAVLQTSCLTN